MNCAGTGLEHPQLPLSDGTSHFSTLTSHKAEDEFQLLFPASGSLLVCCLLKLITDLGVLISRLGAKTGVREKAVVSKPTVH